MKKRSVKAKNWKDLQLKYCAFILKELIKQENLSQIEKWGIQDHCIFEWLTYITEEQGELSKAISEYVYRNGDVREIVNEGVQVIVLTLKVVEMALKRELEGK